MPEFNLHKEPGTRPGKFFYHIDDGFYFHEIARFRGRIYFNCVRAAKDCCGRAVFDETDGFVLTRNHNHGPHHQYLDEIAFRRNFLQMKKL